MTRITGAEHVVLLLREKLARTARERVDGRSTTQAGRVGPRPLERLRAMDGLDALGNDDRRRAVVHGLLIEELGDAVANDAAFRLVLDEVMRIIKDLPGGPELIDQATTQLRDA